MKSDSRLAARPFFDERDIPEIMFAIEGVLRSGRLILGPQTEALEREFASYVGTRYAIAVSSCSAALEITLRVVGVKGREVILPTNTFVATANALLASAMGTSGLVFCECDDDGNFDVVDALQRVTDKTVALVIVYVAGFVPRAFDRLVWECRERHLMLVEDCAHAHGATYRGCKLGSFGDAGCFSFYPTKVMTCGVGGMITTDREDIAEAARSLRHHGQGSSLEDVVAIGSDWLMDEVRAVLARGQLRRLDEVLMHRRRVAARYTALLAGTEVAAHFVLPESEPAYYKYPVTLPAKIDRDVVRKLLLQRYGIETGALYWPPVHRMPAYAPLGLRMPRTEAILKRRLCLPMHGRVDPADCDEIIRALFTCIREVS